MRDYRCYHIDARGHIVGVEVFEVPSDSDACDRARLIVMNLQWSASMSSGSYRGESELPKLIPKECPCTAKHLPRLRSLRGSVFTECHSGMFRGNEIPTGNRPIRVLSALRTKRGRSGRYSRAAFPSSEALPSFETRKDPIAKPRPFSRATKERTQELLRRRFAIVAETAPPCQRANAPAARDSA